MFVIGRGNDTNIIVRGMTDALTGAYINTATISAELFDASDVSLGTVSLTYVSASNGDYRGVLSATIATSLTAGQGYKLVVTSTSHNSRRVYAARAVELAT